ncbi:MAG: hypothetical protein SGPRY_010475, partial [Prymnesium sp.]
MTNDPDSPTVRSDPPAERKVPSCPQKAQRQSSHTKRHSSMGPQTGNDNGDEIGPSALRFDEADEVSSLSLSPMNMKNSPPLNRQKGRPDLVAGAIRLQDTIDDMHAKRMRTGEDTERPSIVRGNSMQDRKILYARIDREPSLLLDEKITFEEHFTWGRKLGSGSFFDVHLVRKLNNPSVQYAVKRSKHEFKSRTEREKYLREVFQSRRIDTHPNVVEYYRAWQEEYVFFIQMELCEGGTLRNLLDREGAELCMPHAEPRVWEMTTHIARGLAHIHASDIMHCDLKPDNILISADGNFKIGDLGHATTAKAWDEQEGDSCYLSRDLLDARPSVAADIFSFGIMLYEIKSNEKLPGHGDRLVATLPMMPQ